MHIGLSIYQPSTVRPRFLPYRTYPT